jgi:GrpB-like predicted nucleotidyltransferase (UPF0157 family)
VGPRLPLRILKYDPRWPTIFDIERQRILMLIGNKLEAIEHIGSTSIPGICSKPCIDIAIGFGDMRVTGNVENLLLRLGYTRVIGFEDWIILGKSGSMSFRLHLVPHESRRWHNFILFRNYLRSHPAIAAEYSRQKQKLAIINQADRPGYALGKSSFVQSVENIAWCDTGEDQ